MNLGLIFSLILHGCVLIFILFGMPNMFMSKKEMIQDYAVVIEVVKVSDITNVNVKKSTKSETSKTDKEAPKSAKMPESTEVEKKVDDKVAEQKVDDAEAIKKVKEVKKKEEKKPEKKIVKKVDDKKNKDKDVDFAKNILKSIEEDKKKKEDKKVDKNFSELADSLKGDTNKEYNENLPMTISEIDAIKSQITRNWNTTAFSGADSKGMAVTVNIEVDMDGNVIRIVPNKEFNSSQYYNSFIESAVRAIKQSSPLKELDKNKYHSWKEIEFRFDSEGMIY